MALGVVTGAALVLIAAGFLAARFVESPAQEDADTKPPAPSLLSAPVAYQVVRDPVVLRGVVLAPREYTATPTSAYGIASNGAPLVVTRAPVPDGNPLGLGQVIVEVSGRPLFLLEGSIPMYRDLAPGDSGSDVAELQTSLQQMGLPTGADRVGSYGAGTKAAVAAFYGRIGYAVPQAGDPQATAQAAATVAQDAQALKALGTTPTTAAPSDASGASGASGSQILAARQALDTAEAAYQAALATSGPMVPQGEAIVVPTLPAHLVGLSAGVGATVGAPLVTVSVGNPTVQGQLDPTQASLVRAGMSAVLDDSLRGYTSAATVASVASAITTPSGSDDTPYVAVGLAPRDPPPTSEIGANLEVTIEAAQTAGPVLAVPESAVFAGADGRTYVNEIDAAGRTRRVAIRAGLDGGGMVQVTPTGGAALGAGDLVVTGLAGASGGGRVGGSGGSAGAPGTGGGDGVG